MSTVIGVFRDVKSAEEAVRSLRNNGFEENEISIIAKDDRGKTVKQDMEVGGEMGMGQENIADGTAWGGALGGVAGLLAGVGALAISGLARLWPWPCSQALCRGPLLEAWQAACSIWVFLRSGGEYENELKQGGILAVVETSEDKVNDASAIFG